MGIVRGSRAGCEGASGCGAALPARWASCGYQPGTHFCSAVEKRLECAHRRSREFAHRANARIDLKAAQSSNDCTRNHIVRICGPLPVHTNTCSHAHATLTMPRSSSSGRTSVYSAACCLVSIALNHRPSILETLVFCDSRPRQVVNFGTNSFPVIGSPRFALTAIFVHLSVSQ